MSDTTIIALGRYGDIVNVLPLAWDKSRSGTVRWIVSSEFAGIFNGISYVKPILFSGEYHNSVQAALQFAKNEKLPNLIIAQPCNPPDKRRLTDSYQREAWRLAGSLESFGTLPAPQWQEGGAEWCNYIPGGSRKKVLVSTGGISSPYENQFKLLANIRGLDCEVVDLSLVKLDCPQDLVRLIEAADLLVTTDSLPLHLARSTNTPVVSIINEGWKGSVPPPQSVETFRYSADMGSIVDFVNGFINHSAGKVIHVADLFGNEERHKFAQSTWKPGVFRSSWSRDASSIGDGRKLPFLKSMLLAALEGADDSDCILWTNDDVDICDYDAFSRHVSKFDYGCIRRDAKHVGREAFFFRAGWLREHLDEMPDVIIGVPWFDLVLARWMRDMRGIKTTEENIGWDFSPVEIQPGAIYHEPHESSWLQHQESPAAIHNRNLWLKN